MNYIPASITFSGHITFETETVDITGIRNNQEVLPFLSFIGKKSDYNVTKTVGFEPIG